MMPVLSALRKRLRKARRWARTRFDRQDERTLRQRFNRLASEQRFGKHMDRDHAWFTGRVLDRLRISPGDRVLEIACGDGWAVRMGAERAPGTTFVGVDISDVMLGLAAPTADAQPGARLVQGSADMLPFQDQVFTAAFCVESFFLFPSLERASREMMRVILPGGTAYVVQCLYSENRKALGCVEHLNLRLHVRSGIEYRRLLEATGWAEVEVVELHRDDAMERRPDPHDRALLLVARKPVRPPKRRSGRAGPSRPPGARSLERPA